MSVFKTAGVAPLNPGKFTASYSNFDRTSCDVTLTYENFLTQETYPAWWDRDSELQFAVYSKVGDFDFRYYLHTQTPVRSGSLARGSSAGSYTASYSYLPSGTYIFFAVIQEMYPAPTT